MTKADQSGNYTRGSQLWSHKIRMLLQGLRNSSIFGLVFALLLFLYRMYQYLTLSSLYYFMIERFVQLKLALGMIFYGQNQIGVTFYNLKQHKMTFEPALKFVHQFWNTTPYGACVNKLYFWMQHQAILEVSLAFLVGFIGSILLFVQRGSKIIGSEKIRGGDIVSRDKLIGLIRSNKAASKISIGGLPLIRDTERQHILLTGTTGSGKTNLLNELLPQIKRLKQKAIVVDFTGSFYERFFDQSTDLVLNPFEGGTVDWLPWNDCSRDFEFDALASAFVDGEGFTDKYWEEAAQKVLSEALKKESTNKSISQLLDILIKMDLPKFCDYFQDTFAAGLVSKEAEKGTASVRATLINKIERLKYLKEGGTFGIKEWINNPRDNGWLFITASPSQRDTLRPIASAWIDIAIKGLMERSPVGNEANDNMWFILDELPVLKKIPSLKRGLAEGRKYGACFVAGIQNIFQLEEIYGRASSFSLLDMFNTRYFFKVGDETTAEYAAKNLGKQEILDTRESLSYGSNTVRDGVNINNNERVRQLVMPEEIKNLPTRTCFVRLAGNYPITKLAMNIQNKKESSKFKDKNLININPVSSNILFEELIENKEARKINIGE